MLLVLVDSYKELVSRSTNNTWKVPCCKLNKTVEPSQNGFNGFHYKYHLKDYKPLTFNH